MSDANDRDVTDRLTDIERRLASIDETLKAMQKEPQVVKALKEHVADLKTAMRAIADMASMIKSRDD